MHELGILLEVVDTVEQFALENSLTKVASITLLVGEVCPVIPEYLQDCFPAAVDKSVLLHDSKLKIEIAKANNICHKCSKIFSVLENKKRCPFCGSSDSEIVSGREFEIKEIEAM